VCPPVGAVGVTRSRLSALSVLLALLIGFLVPFTGVRAQGCGDTLVPDGTAGSCAADGGGTGGGPLDPTAPVDAGSAGADPLAPPATVGNPISLFTGNKREVETDFALPGAALAFRRFYNSANEAYRSGVGQGWSHTYAVSLFATPDGARELLQSDGRRLHFESAGTDDEGRALFRTGSAFEGVLVALADDAHRWELPDGRHLSFNGSYLIEIDWPDQRRLSLYYRQRRLVSVTDETGRVLRLAYWPGVPGGDRALGGYKAQDFGAASGQLASLTLPDGEVIEYAYDQRSNLTRTAYPDGTHREYHYEDETYPSHLTGLTDRTGVRFATWAYDGQGRAVSSEHAGGVERVTLDYPDAAAIEAGQTVGTTVTNSQGQPSLYTWEQPMGGAPRLLEATGPGCASCPPTGMRWSYDEAGRLSSATITGEGTVTGAGSTQYAYDELDRLMAVQRIMPDGTSTPVERREYATPADLEPVRIVRPSVNPDSERITVFERDERGRVTAMSERGWSPLGTSDAPGAFEPIERTVRHGYQNGVLVTVDGPRDDVDDVVRFERDELNRLIGVQTPLSPALRMTGFDTRGRVTSFRIGTQSPVSIAYDPNGRPSRIEQRGRPITFGYDAEARLTGFTGPDGASTRLVYGPGGRLSELVDAASRRTTFDTDEEGRTTGRVELGPDGTLIRSVATLFDALGRVSSITTEQAGPSAGGSPVREIRHHGHDASGRLASVADGASGERVEIARTDLGQLARISEPDGTATAFEYDAAGQEIALVDARDNRTLYLKDDLGRVVVHLSPDTGTTSYRYDAAGNRVERRDADGVVTRYAWDAANRLTLKASPDGAHRYVYDPANGQLIESASPATTERFGFDAERRLVEHERLIDGSSFTTTYGHDAQGRIETKGLPDGQTLRHHYHEDGEQRGSLRAITRASLFGLRQETLVGEIDTDERDGRTGHVSHNGLATRREHAPDGRITAISIDETLRLAYTYDASGRIVGIDRDGKANRYDWGRSGLVGANTTTGVYRFDHDAAGNRTARSHERSDGRTEASTYRYPREGGGNRLLGTDTLVEELDPAIGTRAVQSDSDEYLYNGAGAPLAARAGLSYAYDAERRPIRVHENGELLAEYAYNGFGERIRKVVYRGDGRRVTYFLYDGHQLTTEIEVRADGTAGEMRQGVFVDEQPVAYLIGRTVHAVHTDALGTPRIATDEAGQRVWAADYDPLGRAEITTEQIELPYRLPGQYADAETGTHYNYYRDYDPGTGRYLTSDPIGLQGGLNTYRYANNDPLGMSDPLGLVTALGEGSNPEPNPRGDTPAKPSAEDEQAYSDKLVKLLDATIENLKSRTGQDVAIQFLEGLVQNIGIVTGVVVALAGAHALGVGAAADAVLIAGAWMLAGYEAGKFIVDLVVTGFELRDTDLCDDAAFERLGETLGNSVVALGEGLAESVLLGALGKLGRALDSAEELARGGAWAVWRSLRRFFGDQNTVAGLCSFAGDTLVSTRDGYRPIRDIESGEDEVWARDERTGRSGWRAVLARYHNRYEETVEVTTRSSDGRRQTIRSNRIHPYFARIAAGALIATSGTVAIASEGHVYQGEIAGATWVDAQHLKAGDELLSDHDRWQTVESVEIEAQPLQAYNLTVDEYSTYFVAGAKDANAVWVHNQCHNDLPDGYSLMDDPTDFGQPRYVNNDGAVLYQGHDGRYYDPTVPGQEPSANGIDGPKSNDPAGPILSAQRSFSRSGAQFFLRQGNASSGWKHIYDRHVDVDRFPGKSKFPENWSENDVAAILGRTIKHGKAGSYQGLRIFEYRTNHKGAGYQSYRVTINEDGTVRTFHPLG